MSEEALERCISKCSKILSWIILYLEDINLLDPLNEIHLFSLHYVYLPRINRHLQEWQNGWNNHNLRTEHNFSPFQLYTVGLHRLIGSSSRIAQELTSDVFETVNDQVFIWL